MNSLNLCVILFLIIVFIKYSHYYFDICILTPLEMNDHYPVITEVGRTMFTSLNMNLKKVEELLINFVLFLICIKVLFLILIKYYKINIFKYVNFMTNINIFKILNKIFK
jgi:hypothetical protein